MSQTALGEKSLGKKSDHAYRQFKPNCRITADILNVTDKTLYDNCFGLTQKFGELSDLLRTRDICDFSRRNN